MLLEKIKENHNYNGAIESSAPSFISISSDLSTAQTIKLALEYINSNSLECDFHELFFAACKEKNLNVLNGAVQTPSYVAAFMVGETVQHLGDYSIEKKWFDPCCGSGVFPEEIILYAIQGADIKSVSMLPRIHALDMSAFGVFCTIINIHKIIDPLGISISEYMDSGRLRVEVKDTLSFFEEETLFSQELYDVVIGNPPYIRSLRIDKKTKELLKSTFPVTHSGTADLYYYFISGGINALSHDGILCYISPANFFRLKSAAGLRNYLHQHAALLKLIDLDETKVFDNADVHSAIYWMRRGRKDLNNVFAYSHLHNTSDLIKLSNHSVNYQDMSITGIKPDFWSFSEQKHNAPFINKNHLVSLKETGIKIYSGIRPNLKKAFVWKHEDLSSLSDDEIKKWFRPCVTAQELKQWSPENKNLHLLFISDEKNPLPDKISALLKPFEEELIARAGAEARTNWHTLRRCAYYSVFERNRILFPDICSKAKFCLATDNRISVDGTFAMDSDSLAILGLLNSTRIWNHLTCICSSIGNANNKGRLRIKKAYVENLQVPKKILGTNEFTKDLGDLVQDILDNGENPSTVTKINNIIDRMYAQYEN